MLERLRTWGSCLGLVAMLFVTAVAGFLAYRIDQRDRATRGAGEQPTLMMQLSGTTLEIFSEPEEGEDPRLVARVAAELIEVSRDQTRTEISQITAIEVYRGGEVYLVGNASRATYDEQLKELTLRDGVHFEQQQGSGVAVDCEEIVYYTDTDLLVATRRVVAKMGDAELKTPTARINVATRTFSAPRKVAVETGKGGTLYADSASGDLDGQRLSLIGNVVLASTVGELRGLGATAPSAGGPVKNDTPLRVRAGRADMLFAEDRVSASEGIAVVTEQGSVTAKRAEVAGDNVRLTGGATVTLAGKPPAGPITVETASVEYQVKDDRAVCPGSVTARVREGEFRAAHAEARLMKGSWRLGGGVKGTLNPGVLSRR